MKRHLRLISLICALALLGGCGLAGSALDGDVSHAAMQAGDVQDTAVLEFQAPLYTDAEPESLWGRAQLSVHAQEAYDQMSGAIACRRDTPLEVDADSDEIELILTALRIDHPEYFWFDGEASFVTSTLAGVAYRTECTFVYTMDLDEIREAHQQVQQYTAACLSSPELAGAETDYEKILGVYRYIIRTTDYVLAETDQSIVSVMGRHAATCAGYARTFQYLMSQLDIPCTLALGEDAEGQSHGWNMVQCGGSWYQMDVTWGDPVNADQTPGSRIRYTYCLVTDEEMYRDHTLTSPIPMPECVSSGDNYYIREGRYFESWDPRGYERAMDAAAEAGESWFSVRFSSLSGYEAALDALFGEKQVWDMLSRCGADEMEQVSYTKDDQFYEISVLLGGKDAEEDGA